MPRASRSQTSRRWGGRWGLPGRWDRVAIPMITGAAASVFHRNPCRLDSTPACRIMYLIRSTLQGGHVQKDFTKFANQRFLKTVDWEVLGKLLAHRAGIKGLDLEALLADEIEGRKQITEYLLGSKDLPRWPDPGPAPHCTPRQPDRNAAAPGGGGASGGRDHRPGRVPDRELRAITPWSPSSSFRTCSRRRSTPPSSSRRPA